MTVALAPTAAQIRAQVEAVLRQDARVRALGIRSPSRQNWPETAECSGRPFRIVWCESSLAARQALATLDSDGGLVLVTNLGADSLGDDVLARLAKARLLTVEAWEMVRDAFQARNVDPRISGKSWIAELLLEHGQHVPYPPVPGGLLDADTAWHHLLDRVLGIPMARPDAETLLSWTIGEGNLSRFTQLPHAVRYGVAEWLGDVAGPVGSLVASCVEAGLGADALPCGLVSSVVFGESWTSSTLTTAAVRLEPYVGGRRIAAEHGRAWAEAASRTLRTLEPVRARRTLERADALLSQIHAGDFAASSRVLLSGFEARLTIFADHLTEAVTSLTPGSLAALETALRRVMQHEQAKVQTRRAEQASMATRLMRWLATPERRASTFTEAATGHIESSAFVDWARSTLTGGDEQQALATAYATSATVARQRRELENLAFAEHLSGWNASPVGEWPLVPVERILDVVVAPLASHTPVLLLVMDGLSHAIYRELLPDFQSLGWFELRPEGRPAVATAIAMLPTITEISRTSLFCGKSAQGNASTEKTGFTQHQALRTAGEVGNPPVLFHKADLGTGGDLTAIVREELGNPGRRVVGLVHNAIDDHLDGPQQMRQRWKLEDLHHLRSILHEARSAGRVIVLTADHGHLLESGTREIGKGEGERWRLSDGLRSPEEITFTKGRVLTPEGGNSVVLPWSETVRYSMRKTGYHGGASPQEVLAPLAVLSAGVLPPGWTGAPPVMPEWWEGTPAASVAPHRLEPTRSLPSRRSNPQPTLFDVRAPITAEKADDWIARLLASPVYAAQKQLAARGAPKDEEVRRVLAALSERGGKLSRTALAKRLDVSQVRVGTVFMAVRRVLNVDQVRVLDVEEASGTVVLNRALLDTQFELTK